jgi:hypothetical protein
VNEQRRDEKVEAFEIFARDALARPFVYDVCVCGGGMG